MQRSLYVAVMQCAAFLLLLTPISAHANTVSGGTAVALNSSAVTRLPTPGVSSSLLATAIGGTQTSKPSVFGVLAGSLLAIGGLAFRRSRNRAQPRSRCCNYET